MNDNISKPAPAGRAYFRAVGKRITELRRERQFTQAELARLLGVSQQTVFSVELGDRRLRLDLVPTLTRTFGVSADVLLGIRPPPALRRHRVSPRLMRHVEGVRQLSTGEQRLVLRLAEVLPLARVSGRSQEREQIIKTARSLAQRGPSDR